MDVQKGTAGKNFLVDQLPQVINTFASIDQVPPDFLKSCTMAGMIPQNRWILPHFKTITPASSRIRSTSRSPSRPMRGMQLRNTAVFWMSAARRNGSRHLKLVIDPQLC